jgi:predicted Zn-dependent protease
LERALALEPGDLSVLGQFGQTALAAGKPARAVEVCTELTRLDPDHAASWVHLARACAAAGDRARAEQALSRALAIDPQNKAALELRGRLR